jgi:DNA-binding CsgD family transcriptional regulator
VTETITAEQRAILLGHAAGRYTAAIAAELGLTLGQYLSHRGRLLAILGAFDTTHALAIAVVRGIVTAEDLRRAGCY